ncbi:MAG: peptide chain release factor N(5)-glutamine methyltransferase [Oscillospiraceae bacterium]|nr:peptide chain release factor N(5)-glutamine methyltransferase [Oscillospiraceae bacterium]
MNYAAEAAKLLTNSETPLLDARVLLSFVTKTNAALLFRPLTEDEERLFNGLIERRAAGEPVAYIVGEKEFMGLSFSLNKDTLIPRPDTETVVEFLLERYKGRAPKILDLCCGSGCIGISLCHYLPDSKAVLADIAEGALKASEENAKRHGLSDRVYVCRIDVLTEALGSGYDIIVSNPPYIPSAVTDTLEVTKTEPRLALDGGESGLDFYRAITPKAMSALNPGGTLAFEIGYDQSESVSSILRENGFVNTLVKKDYGGNFRLAAGEKG